MSASLVGSEMCIRDRCRRRSGLPGVGRLGALADQKRGALVGGILEDQGVSYTHLTLPTICSV
eukprot:6505490-Alexandrium_andersonii.AAC.1